MPIVQSIADASARGYGHLNNSKGIVTSNLVFYLDAGQYASYPGAGTTWYDISGTGNNTTLYNGPSYTSGNGGAFVFDGSNDYGQTGTVPSFNLGSTTTWSIELWLYINTSVDTSGIYHGVLEVGPDSASFGIGIWRSGLYPGCLYNVYGNNTMFGTDGGGSYTGTYYKCSGKWTHLVFTRDSSTSYFYLNGALWGTRATPSIPNQSNYMNIGRLSTNYLPGQIPVVRAYHKALTQVEALNNYNIEKARFGL